MMRTPGPDTAPTSGTVTEETYSVNHVRLMPPGLPSERPVTTGLPLQDAIAFVEHLSEQDDVLEVRVTREVRP